MAAAIVAGGFRDGQGTYMTQNAYRGVWFADRPLDVNEGASGDTVLALSIPDDVLAEWEWAEEGKRYREFLVPAEIVNSYPASIVEVDE